MAEKKLNNAQCFVSTCRNNEYVSDYDGNGYQIYSYKCGACGGSNILSEAKRRHRTHPKKHKRKAGA